MPAHPERVRTASLPAGYQFGDSRPAPFMCGMMGLGMAHVFEPTALVCNCGEKGRWTSTVFTSDRDLGDER